MDIVSDGIGIFLKIPNGEGGNGCNSHKEQEMNAAAPRIFSLLSSTETSRAMGNEYRTASYGRVLFARESGFGELSAFLTARPWSRVSQV
jgi:hypothetical protein